MTTRTQVAIIGTGNIGTDLLIKVLRVSKELAAGAFVGIDADSDGLKRATRLGVPISTNGIDGLVSLPNFHDIEIVFDATSAASHKRHDSILRRHGKRVIDLTPAALGCYAVPAVNGDANLDAPNIGAAHYLPEYAGNLDIMTSAALQVGESVAAETRVRSIRNYGCRRRSGPASSGSTGSC